MSLGLDNEESAPMSLADEISGGVTPEETEPQEGTTAEEPTVSEEETILPSGEEIGIDFTNNNSPEFG